MMRLRVGHCRYLALLAAFLMSACSGVPTSPASEKAAHGASSAKAGRALQAIQFALPEAWGGQLQCAAPSDCLLGAVEHETGKLSLVGIRGRVATLLDQKHIAMYSPFGSPYFQVKLCPGLITLVSVVAGSAHDGG